jgi:hypothetical protein
MKWKSGWELTEYIFIESEFTFYVCYLGLEVPLGVGRDITQAIGVS